jgi:hypothetical protein
MEKMELKDEFNVSDSVKITSLLDPVAFRREFEKYKDSFLKMEGTVDLIMAYLILQFYIENHFHYYLRFIIGDGFSSPKEITGWNEKKYPNEKIDCLQNFLVQHGFSFNHDLFSTIQAGYRAVTDIRNLLAHGHQVSTTLENSTKTESKAKSFLNRQEFGRVCGLVIEMAQAWNELLKELQQQEQLLRSSGLPMPGFFDNCKFKVF